MKAIGFDSLLQRAALLLAAAALSVAIVSCGAGGNDDSASTAAGDVPKVNHGRFPAPVENGNFEEAHPGFATYHSTPLQFEADPSQKLSFTKSVVMGQEGNVSVEFKNPSSTPQNIAIETIPRHERIVSETIADGFTAMAVTLYRKEKYIFYSTLPGHRKASVHGVIKVTPPK